MVQSAFLNYNQMKLLIIPSPSSSSPNMQQLYKNDINIQQSKINLMNLFNKGNQEQS